MAVYRSEFVTDIAKPFAVRPIAHQMAAGDVDAYEFTVLVADSRAPETGLMAGSVSGAVVRPDGGTVVITGEKGTDVRTVQLPEGECNATPCTITIPQAALAYPGRVVIVIRLLSGEVETTVLAASATVARTLTGTVIDPGEAVPDITTLLAQIQACKDATEAAEAVAETTLGNFAPEFDAAEAHAAGSFVTYAEDGKLYLLPEGHTAGTSWANTTHTETDFGDQVSDLKSAAVTGGNAIVNPDNYAILLPNLNNAPANSVYIIVPTANAKPANMPTDIEMSQFYTLLTLNSNAGNGITQILMCPRQNKIWQRISQNASAWYAWYRITDGLATPSDISSAIETALTGVVKSNFAIVNPDNYATVLPDLNSAPKNAVYTIVPTSTAKPANMPADIQMSQFYTLITLSSNAVNGITQILMCPRLNLIWVRVSQNASAWYSWFNIRSGLTTPDDVRSIAGDLIEATVGYKLTEITFIANQAILRDNNDVIDINSPGSYNGWYSAVVPCEQGDEFIVSGTAVGNPRLWAFINANGNILSMEEGMDIQYVFRNVHAVAPANTAYIVLNNHSPEYASYQVSGKNEIIVAADGSGHYTSLTEALYSTSKNVVVRAGVYDIPTEYKAFFGNNVFDSLSDNTTGMNYFQFGLYVTERTVRFEPGAEVTCDMDDTTYEYILDSHHRFCPFNLGSNAVIDGLKCTANKVWYLIHDDFGGVNQYYRNEIKNCVLTMTNSINRNIIGGGTKNHSTNIVSGCYMDNGYRGSATPSMSGEGALGEVVRYHNYNSSAAQPYVRVEGCRVNGFIGARYYGAQSEPKMTFVAHNNSTKTGIVKLQEDTPYNIDNVDLIAWGNVIES